MKAVKKAPPLLSNKTIEDCAYNYSNLDLEEKNGQIHGSPYTWGASRVEDI